MYRQIERAVRFLAVAMAWLGGLALVGLVLLSVVSIAGRAGQVLGLPVHPVRGDTEWVEFGTGFAVFAFLPWCTLMRGHATVDLLQPLFGRRGNRVLELIAELLLLALAVLVTLQTWYGLFDKMRSGETTWIGQMPVWWGYAASMIGGVAFCIVSAFCVLRALRAFTSADGDAAGGNATGGGTL